MHMRAGSANPARRGETATGTRGIQNFGEPVSQLEATPMIRVSQRTSPSPGPGRLSPFPTPRRPRAPQDLDLLSRQGSLGLRAPEISESRDFIGIFRGPLLGALSL